MALSLTEDPLWSAGSVLLIDFLDCTLAKASQETNTGMSRPKTAAGKQHLQYTFIILPFWGKCKLPDEFKHLWNLLRLYM